MKKGLITTSIILLASFNFYAKQINTNYKLNNLKSKILTNKYDSEAILPSRSRMDIGQADIK